MKTDSLIAPLPAPGPRGERLVITPERAGWQYVGFAAYELEPGQTFAAGEDDNEQCVVLLGGLAQVTTNRQRWTEVGKRQHVFERIPPYAVYVPAGERAELTALTKLELAVCSAPGGAAGEVRVITPEQVGVETRGSGSMERTVHHILPETAAADSLLVVEVFTPGGHWSSYPPHKHDRDRLPDESALEETYYYRIRPERGFALQRVYGGDGDGAFDESLAVRNGEATLVPRGYHTVAAPPGYETYYLNVMAGPVRTWRICNDPDHEWLVKPRTT
ncbi:MAG: 5-deoxy-glucuronate isomerase [Paenibacillaceae bacterium]|nr:5-deoxy-glucuronate isomerase [Paenibacillaceae bacterium]